MMPWYWIFDTRVHNMCLFWWRHFDITSDFLFSKLFSLSSNILSFSFKQREHLFHWGLYALKWFFTAMLHLGWNFLLLSSSTRRIVSYGFYVDWCWRLFSGLRIIFWMCFHKFFCSFWLCNSFCHKLLWLYTGCFLGGNFRLHFWMFWITGLFNVFLLCVLIFDLILGIHG